MSAMYMDSFQVDTDHDIYDDSLYPEKPELTVTGAYVYNGQEQIAEVGGYDPQTMQITGATATDAGTYTITSVQIEEGDSLWSIAKDHYSDEFSSLNSFISEIKRMNGLTSDTLYAGSYILVPQYVLY